MSGQPQGAVIAQQTPLNTASSAQIDPTDSKWAEVKNWANFRLGRFDQATKDHYILHFDDYREGSDCRRCEKYRDFFLKYSMSHFQRSIASCVTVI